MPRELVDVPIFKAGQYPERGIPDANVEYLDRLIANSNLGMAAIDLNHSQDDDVFDFGHLVPGSFRRDGDFVWATWSRYAGDLDRIKARGLSVTIDRREPRITKCSITSTPLVREAHFSEDDPLSEFGCPLAQGEVHVPKTNIGCEATTTAGDAEFARMERELAALKADKEASDAKIAALVELAVQQKAEFAVHQAEAIQRAYVAEGVPPAIAERLAPFAAGLTEATFGEGGPVGFEQAARQVLDLLKGTIKFSSTLPGREESPTVQKSSLDRLDEMIAKFQADGIDNIAEATTRAIKELVAKEPIQMASETDEMGDVEEVH